MLFIKKLLAKLIARVLLPLHKSPTFRREFFKAMKGGGFLATSVSNEIFVVSTTDKIIGRDVYANGSYDLLKLEGVIKLLPDGHSRKTIVDVGANIGVICIPAVKRGIFKYGICIEPDPLNFRLLKGNVILNSLEDVMTLHNVALSSERGIATLELSSDNLGDHRIRTDNSISGKFNESSRKTLSINTLTLDDVCGDLRSDDSLIWIDTQGYEGFILKGGKNCLSKKIPIVLEFWPYAMRQAGSYASLKQSLLDAGYSTFFNLETFKKFKLTNESLDDLYNSFTKDRSFTDILVL